MWCAKMSLKSHKLSSSTLNNKFTVYGCDEVPIGVYFLGPCPVRTVVFNIGQFRAKRRHDRLNFEGVVTLPRESDLAGIRKLPKNLNFGLRDPAP